MIINKDTRVYGSFSLKAGNNGCKFFNEKFTEYNINAIYKSFSITDIKDAVISAKTLGFSGFAVSMPFKKEILLYLDELSKECKIIGACNTVVNNNGKLIGHNTDYIGVKPLLEGHKEIIILGDGGMASAVRYCCSILNINIELITRRKWEIIKDLKNRVIVNCTPVTNLNIDKSNIFIDTIPTTENGLRIFRNLAREQFFLYTGIKIN